MFNGGTTGIPVLMYHALEDKAHPAGAKDAGEQLYVLQVSSFREQMEFLHREGYQACLLDDYPPGEKWPDRSVVLTFDDGHESNFTIALPILREFGFKAHFFVTTGWIGMPHFMSEAQIRGLHQDGMGIGSHGVTHGFISDLDDDGIEFELGGSKRCLEELLGAGVNSFSAPGGRICRRSVKVAERLGYAHLLTSEVGIWPPEAGSGSVPRCALRASTSLSEFAAIAAGDRHAIGRMARRAGKLALAKKILGNRAYGRIRQIFLK